jgi:NAD(P)-dependent dehydrogenase (short-subunit alcohol dehydrogenase family)
MISDRLSGRLAVISGAASGIGLAAVERFVAEGAYVVGLDRAPNTGDSVVHAGARGGSRDHVEWIRVDVVESGALTSAVAGVIEHHGRIDIVYANAGMISPGGLDTTSDEAWETSLDLNLSAQISLVKAALPGLVRSENGAVVLTASEQAFLPARDMLAYVVAKGAVPNLVRALAVELSDRKVRVNAVAPGPVDTPMLRSWFQTEADPDAAIAAQLRPVLLKRLGRPAEIAAAAAFLASDDSSFMTGQTIVVDGGLTAWAGL